MLIACLPKSLRLALLFVSLGSPALAFACPQGQFEVCVTACVCVPNAGEVLGPLYEQMTQVAAPVLQQWLVQSRDSAALEGTQAIPLNIKIQLEKYYSLEVLESVRYKVGDNSEMSAARTMLQNPDITAVTLIDIIVFRTEDDALNNVALWAHELKHVQQYQEWGVQEFAIRYTRDFSAVEAPGYEIQREIAKALR
ncbi:DUF4157 domain-containing protein [Pseudomonas sp. LS44]|uniref:DUF4157 domain-containing protein n=1 Tax=Pseudomonas sp. LS44 TaxID=1357074 RepID=UPI00215A7E04|nr:DUF4157 domain-containing protein [Pseudomonas sp. LS44]UVE16924.1 DUF4157 domain-containing protein [Pseudomonas sp. LS44]